MTEADWCARGIYGHDAMLGFLLAQHANKASERKLRLYALACAHVAWDDVNGERVPAPPILSRIEKFADGEIKEEEVGWLPNQWWDEVLSPWTHARDNALDIRTAFGYDFQHQLREIVGNPINPVELTKTRPKCPHCDSQSFIPVVGVKEDPVEEMWCRSCKARFMWPRDAYKCPWLTPEVLSIAQECYDRRDWADFPILADALEDAGCTEPRLLSHLRGQDIMPCVRIVSVRRHKEEGWGVFFQTFVKNRYVPDFVSRRREEAVKWASKKYGIREWSQDKNAKRTATASCYANVITAQAFPSAPHYLGCWALDLILGKE